ncbi:MAG: hypothetical protein PUK86_12010 [bacterium]|nr:hypothetical protein [bacterium]
MYLVLSNAFTFSTEAPRFSSGGIALRREKAFSGYARGVKILHQAGNNGISCPFGGKRERIVL